MKTTTALFLTLLASVPAFAQYQPPAALANPDYFAVANYANSPLPAGAIASIAVLDGGRGYTSPSVSIHDPSGTLAQVTAYVGAGGEITSIVVTSGGSGYIAPTVVITDPTGSGAMASASIGGPLIGGVKKFVDDLPGFCGYVRPGGACIPIAQRDASNPYGSDTDFYSIGLQDFTQQMHSSLPATRLRGYVQLDPATETPIAPQTYLGPFIVARRDRPVRIKFSNQLWTGSNGDLFLPTDSTYRGAGTAPDGSWHTQNRAVLHLQGGAAPWISEGTPHQWITPAGEDTQYPKGASFQNVPDMTGPGYGKVADDNYDGQATFFWTNQQSGRFLFYHDQTYGMSRLNTYAGEAAGYLLVDQDQETMLAAGTVPGTIPAVDSDGAPDLAAADMSHLFPLIIQDKTFVPDTETQLLAEDPTWDVNLYGGLGSLWFPHVYIPNQNPFDDRGVNAFGRWDYGPWFWPPQTMLTGAGGMLTVECTSAAYPDQQLQCPITPNPSGTPEAFMDTPVINGIAYPVVHISPAAYRFHVLNASNDRSWNLGLYQAFDPETNSAGSGTEVKMVSAIATIPCSTITRVSSPATGTGIALAGLDGAGNPMNSTGLPSSCWPTTWPTDNREGGVPDPEGAGPAIIQIGSESGLLPAPVAIPSTPVNYEYDRKGATALNVSTHGLWLGPSERADIVVDFSDFPGQTFILYNDAPAPAPAFDSRYDYYTGSPDQVEIGGAPSTKPGYGPNTRTILQIVVDADNSNPNLATFSLNSLKNAIRTSSGIAGAYANSQLPPIVPESAYSSAYNAVFSNHYVRINDSALAYFDGGALPGITVLDGGSGYTNPSVEITGGNGSGAAAVAVVADGAISGIIVTNGGTGYTSAPTISVADDSGAGAVAVAGLGLQRKGIQEAFGSDFGRMNARLGTEVPQSLLPLRNTVPLGSIDPASEIVRPGETQAWKITNNGVDTQFLHFGLFDVQVVNRVTWDGSIRPPDNNEVGWKDTVRVSPSEDTIVALRPSTPAVPFAVPDNRRLLDVNMGIGPDPFFAGLDPLTGFPMPVLNQELSLGWEYAWGSHILGHGDNDMIRPLIFQVPPEVPLNLSAGTIPASGMLISWTDSSVSETRFELERAEDSDFSRKVTSFIVAGSSPKTEFGGTFSVNDTSIRAGFVYYYRVRAVKDDVFNGYTQAGPATATVVSSWASVGPIGTGPTIHLSPTLVTFAPIAIGESSAPQVVSVTNVDSSKTLTLFGYGFTGVNGGDFAQTNDCPATLAPGESCSVSITYTPTGTGPRYGYLVVDNDDPARPQVPASLRSPGYVPTASLEPAALDFGDTQINTTSAPRTLTLSSTNGWPIKVTSVALAGASAAWFGIQNDGCSAGVPAGGSCTIAITFTPAASNTRTASIQIRTDAGSFGGTLSGTGVMPSAGLSTASISFSNVQVNTTSVPQMTVLTNNGTGSLSVGAIVLAGASASWFAQSNDCPVSLAAGSSCAVYVTFTPQATVTRNASLQIPTGAGTLAVALTGTGVAPSGRLDRASIPFGNVQVNTISAPEAVVVTNTGYGPLAISSMSIGGASAALFAYDSGCGGSLESGASCTVLVTFTPTAAVTRTASLQIDTSAGVLAAALSGTGVMPNATFLPAALPFGDVRVNTVSTPQSAIVTNTGTGPLTISGASIAGSGAAAYAYVNGCPAMLSAGGSCTVSVTFTPTVAGGRNASLRVATSAGTKAVALTGRGIQ